MKKILIVLCVFFITAEVWGQSYPTQEPLSWEVVEKTMRQMTTKFIEARKINPRIQRFSSQEYEQDPNMVNLGIPNFADHAYSIWYSFENDYYRASFMLSQETTRSHREVSSFLNTLTRLFIRYYRQPVKSDMFVVTWECQAWYANAEINYLNGDVYLIISGSGN